MRLNGVQFEEGSDQFLPSAYRELDQLVSIMTVHASLEIEVEGHVNAPGEGSKAAQKLSERRAKAVRDYLVERGIDSKRISYVGYGNAYMIYKNPRNEQEEQANRRVEIKFID
jgi:outer membrane protein OmpA-like peptidoglycan-associated protein